MTELERSRKFRDEHPHYYSAKCKAWREAHPERSRKSQRKWRLNNSDKRKVHQLITYRTHKGTLIRQPCLVCGAHAHAHHPDYGKPFQIEWLCPGVRNSIGGGNLSVPADAEESYSDW